MKTTFNLRNLNGTNGFTVLGYKPGGYSGWSVGSAGNFYGDGFDSILVGAPYAEVGSIPSSGQVYLIRGSAAAMGSYFNLSLCEYNAFGITFDNLLPVSADIGLSAHGIGDFNGDGIDDIGISDEYGVRIIFGGIQLSNPFDVRYLDGTNGLVIILDGASPFHVKKAGDANGDGIADVVITDFNGNAYVVFGSKKPFNSPFNASSLDGGNGFTIPTTNTAKYTTLGFAGAGDVNADGIDDLIGPWFGVQICIVYGSKNGFPSSFNSTLNGSNGFSIYENNHALGYSTIRGIGDFNNDGIDDIAFDSTVGTYIVFGQKDFGSSLNIDTLNGKNGFMIDMVGCSASGIGDFNGDNIDDFIICDCGYMEDTGRCVVIYGTNSNFEPVFNMSSINGENGFLIDGYQPKGFLGNAVSGIENFNGNGLSSIIISSMSALNTTGESYVLFGNANFTSMLD